LIKNLFNYLIFYHLIIFNHGDWGLGIGDWGLGIGDWAQSPIPNPQSPWLFIIDLKKRNL
jgi:hypothetical protein